LVEFGSDDYAKYPFLPEVGNYVRDLGISVSALNSEDYDKVIQRAKERIVEAIQKREVSYPLPVSRATSEGEKAKLEQQPKMGGTLVEILSFPISLAVVKATKLEHIANMYALAESKRAVKLLQKSQASKYLDHQVSSLITIFEKVFGITVESIKAEHRDYNFMIPVVDYLKRARFYKEEWKLVNKPVTRGKVILDRQDLVRLIGDEIDVLIRDRLKSIPAGTKLPEKLQEVVSQIIEIAPPPPQSPYTIVHIAPENYPPCVRKAIDLLDKGQNVPHYGRFLMATYLLNVGKSVEEIVAMFPKAPDFRQNITKYQVEHLAGLKGSKTRYRVPSCRTLQTHQFCFKDPVKCYEITNPLQYPSRRAPAVAAAGSRQEERGRNKKREKAQSSENNSRVRSERRDWIRPRRK
jgi:DNA primase large subunit